MVILSGRLLGCFLVSLLLCPTHTATEPSATTARPAPEWSAVSSDASKNLFPESLHSLTASASVIQQTESPDDLQAGSIVSFSPTLLHQSTEVLKSIWERLIVNSPEAYDFLCFMVQAIVNHLQPLASYFDVLSLLGDSPWTPTYVAFTGAGLQLWYGMKPYVSLVASPTTFMINTMVETSQTVWTAIPFTVNTMVGFAQEVSTSITITADTMLALAQKARMLFNIIGAKFSALFTALAIFNPDASYDDVLPSWILYLPDRFLGCAYHLYCAYRVIQAMVFLAIEHPRITILLLTMYVLLLLWLTVVPWARMMWRWSLGPMWYLIMIGLRALFHVTMWCLVGIWRLLGF